MFKKLSIVSVGGLLVFSFIESSILTIIYVFSYFLLFKLYNFGLQIIHLILDYLLFLGKADIRGCLVMAYFER